MDLRVQIDLPFDVRPQTREGRLESRLAVLMNEPVVLTCTTNRRTMISARRKQGALYVRLHRMFLRADAIIVTALARYLRHGRSARVRDLISGFIERHRGDLQQPAPAPETLSTEGKVHDLAEIFGHIAKSYFNNAVRGVAITWGKERRARRRRVSIKLGTYNPDERVIRVHPALDQPYVPRYFVEYVVYHEILHHLIPVKLTARRRVVHSPEFRERERAYPHYVRALMWEARNIGSLLRSR